VAASGLPGYEVGTNHGVFVPAGTPKSIIDRLHQEIRQVLYAGDTKEQLFAAGLEPVGSSPEQFSAKIKSEIVRMSKVIKDAGIRVD
jgi:tripartite-type tricarboxylate transporter receptor subunit TctC